MGKKITLKKFLDTAHEKHGQGKFDYSNITEIRGAHSKCTIICNTCNEEFQQFVYVHMQGHGCPKCGKNQKKSYDIVIAEAREIFGDLYEYPEFEYENGHQKFDIICKKHGVFQKNYNTHIRRKGGCPKKGCLVKKTPVRKKDSIQTKENRRIRGLEKFKKRAIEKYGNLYTYHDDTYINHQTNMLFECTVHGEFYQLPSNHLNGTGCPYCIDVRHNTDGIVDTSKSENTVVIISERDSVRESKRIRRFEFFEHFANLLHNKKYTYDVNTYVNSSTHTVINCKIHGDFKQFPVNHLGGNGCPACSGGKQISNGEKELVEFLKFNYEGTIIENDRTIIHPQEVDVYIPDLEIAIEYCGLYWHCEKHKTDPLYHQKKMQKCADAGIRLITIYEDEWENRNIQVRRKLLNVLNIDKSKRIYARKCKLHDVSRIDKKLFFNENHIQGDGPSSVNIGLYDNDDVLVACMGFSRISNGKWTLNRYATNQSVIGGFSKILSYFKKTYDWIELVSFADLRWSDGNLYDVNGWEMDGILRADYYYIYKKSRRHKFGFRRNDLKRILGDAFDPDETEHQNCLRNRIYRIYDCGKIRYKVYNEKRLH